MANNGQRNFQKKLEDDIYSFFTDKTFLKIKNNAFGIGMVYFFFGTMDSEKKLTTKIDCYLRMADALRLADKIIFGKIKKDAIVEKNKGEQYPKAVWDSGLGGVNEEKAKARGLRSDGKAVSRIFDLAPGASKPYVFTAVQRPGKSNDKGLIVPDYKCDKSEVTTIRVSVENDDELENMAEELKMAIYAYMSAKYVHYYPFDKENDQKPDYEAASKAAPNNRAAENASNMSTSNQPASPASETRSANNETRNQSTPATTGTDNTQIIRLHAKTSVQEIKNSDKVCMQCSDDNGNVCTVVFEKNSVDALNPDKWKQFRDMAEVCTSQPFTFRMMYEKGMIGKNEVMLFKGFCA